VPVFCDPLRFSGLISHQLDQVEAAPPDDIDEPKIGTQPTTRGFKLSIRVLIRSAWQAGSMAAFLLTRNEVVLFAEQKFPGLDA
jgi:hypothetical protein